MLPPNTRRGNLLIAAFLLLLSVVFEQFFIAPFFPMVDAAGSLRLMIVFLDIPLSLPGISWLPVTILFCIFYAVVIGPRLSRTESKGFLGKRVWKALTGWYLLLGCIAAGGGLYYLIEGYLPKQVANGIDSFGINTDLTLPYPSGELLHLHGSMIQLLFGLLGLHLMARRAAMPQSSVAVAEAQAIINTPPPPPQRIPTTTFIKTKRRESATAAEPATSPRRESAMIAEAAPAGVATAPASRRSSVSVTPPPAARTAVTAQERQTPAQDRPAAKPSEPAFPGEPPMCRLTTPPPIAIVMPRAAPTVGKAHPCFVIGGLKPTSRK
ncbi:MAG TPA: hypothetical protein VGS79_22560 [Puia sp.]|nr:hypothetical protein [Puia sp.]